jgi:hypothetical protein
VTDTGFLELADPASGVQTWIGAGLPGLAEGELVVVASETDTLIAAGVTSEGSFEIGDDGITASAKLAGLEVDAAATAEGGTLVLRRDGGEQTLNPAAVGGPAPDAAKAELVRILSVIPGSADTAVTASAARPAKAAHDRESLRAQVSEAGEPAQEVFEPLLSTQYDSTGGQARAGLELWAGEEDQAPLRVSGLRRLEARVPLAGGWELRAAPFIWGLAGGTTAGSYLIWRKT